MKFGLKLNKFTEILNSYLILTCRMNLYYDHNIIGLLYVIYFVNFYLEFDLECYRFYCNERNKPSFQHFTDKNCL